MNRRQKLSQIDTTIRITKLLIVVLFIFAIVIGIIAYHEAEVRYNNGTCVKCGGHYNLEYIVPHGKYTTYIYICDGCKDIIEI